MGALRVTRTELDDKLKVFILFTLVTHNVYKRVSAPRAELRIPNRKEKSCRSHNSIYTCSEYVPNTHLLLCPEVGQSGDQEHVGHEVLGPHLLTEKAESKHKRVRDRGSPVRKQARWQSLREGEVSPVLRSKRVR